MEATLYFLLGGGGGGGGSTGVSTNESVVCEAETVERMYQGPSEGESCFSGEAELELGLGLSLGGVHGRGFGSFKAGGRTERGRILTAIDFPSAVFNGGFSSSSSSSSPASIRASSSSSPAVAVSGAKRAAESVSQDGGSPTGSSQVVGWPPIRTYRMNSLVNQTKASNGKSEEDLKKKKKTKTNISSAGGTAKPGFVKVSMDGVVIGRKLDLNSHSSYQSLAQAVHHMFFSPASSVIANGGGGDKEEAKKISRFLDGSAEFVLTYEDKDGDWMLAGDVPWRMFVGSVKKLRIMRTSDANGLCMHIKVSQTFSMLA